MVQVNALLSSKQYATTISSASGNTVIADESLAAGGGNLGFSPHELLAASLASCTTITLRMYANHKEWDLSTLGVNVALDYDTIELKNIFICTISFPDSLNAEQKSRLLQIAERCPIHKILAGTIQLKTITG
jgi:putative redox protein